MIDLQHPLNKPNYFPAYVGTNTVVHLFQLIFCGYIGWNQLMELGDLNNETTLLYYNPGLFRHPVIPSRK